MEEFLSLQFRGIPDSIFVVSFLILSILIVLVFLLRMNRRTTRISVFSMLLIEYVFLMFCSTVFCRDSHPETTRIELMPFWNYHDVLNAKNPNHYWEVILNVLLYVPIGFLLGCLIPSKSTSKGYVEDSTGVQCLFVVVISAGLSVVTEVLQLVLHRGLCETDDVIHNTLGAVLGFSVLKLVICCFKKFRCQNI